MLTARIADPTGYGRVVRSKSGNVARIVEHVDASAGELAIEEVATSIYCFRHGVLAPTLRRLSPANAQGEYYLTDAIAVLDAAGYRVVTVVAPDPDETAGVNDRAQLAVAEAVLRGRLNERWMRRGVTMIDPAHTYVDAGVELAEEVVLEPGVHLEGATLGRPGGRRRAGLPPGRLRGRARGESRPDRRAERQRSARGPSSARSPFWSEGSRVEAHVETGAFRHDRVRRFRTG